MREREREREREGGGGRRRGQWVGMGQHRPITSVWICQGVIIQYKFEGPSSVRFHTDYFTMVRNRVRTFERSTRRLVNRNFRLNICDLVIVFIIALT